MKKEQKRYFLIEYCGFKEVTYDTKEELDKALDDIRKYNNRKTSKYIVGNMTCNKMNYKYVLTAHLYRRLREKSTISDLDEFTSKYDEKGLIKVLYPRLLTANPDNNKPHVSYYPDINIAYFEDKDQDKKTKNDNVIRRIKYIPVLYKDDTKFLSEEYIRKCIVAHCFGEYIDFNFFYSLLAEFKDFRNCDEEYDELLSIIHKVEYGEYGVSNLYSATMNFYNAFISEREKDGSLTRLPDGSYQKSRRRLRDFGFYVKNYNSKSHKSPTAYAYTDNKTKLEEIKRIRNEIIKDQGEQLSLNLKK